MGIGGHSNRAGTAGRRWGIAVACAVLAHALIVALLALHLRPDNRVTVVRMVPAPGESVALYPGQGLEAAVFFSQGAHGVDAPSAQLYKLDPGGARRPVAKARPHAGSRHAVQFDALSEDGEYEIVVEETAAIAPDWFDGEYDGVFPTGDGRPGGVFRAKFSIRHEMQEVMSASLYDPAKTPANEEAAARPTAQAPGARMQERGTSPRPPKKTSPKKHPPSPNDNRRKAQVQAPSAPVLSEPSAAPPPKNAVPTPGALAISPWNISPTLLEESSQNARKIFEARDTSRWAAAAGEAKARYEAAFAEGPVIGTGRQGNSLSHNKDVAEYLALMHKEIHPRWAHDYLLRLDTVYRRNGGRLQNPDLETVLEITLESSGKVSAVRMVRASGVTDYDSEAIHVAWNASPGVPIPDAMRSNNGKAYIHWTFWRDSRQCGVFGVNVFKYQGSKRDALDFSLKAVQLQEKKLGLEPSVGLPAKTKNTPADPPRQSPVPPAANERINPLDD